MSVDLPTLTALAQAATPGPWTVRRWTHPECNTVFANEARKQGKLTIDFPACAWSVCGPKQLLAESSPNCGAHIPNGFFIAACSPDAILALVARMRELEVVVEAARELVALSPTPMGGGSPATQKVVNALSALTPSEPT